MSQAVSRCYTKYQGVKSMMMMKMLTEKWHFFGNNRDNRMTNYNWTIICLALCKDKQSLHIVHIINSTGVIILYTKQWEKCLQKHLQDYTIEILLRGEAIPSICMQWK